MLRFVLPAMILAAFPVAAQNMTFGGMKADISAPVEVAADHLSVNQGNGNATFTGNVVIGQGEMRLSAETVVVEYAEGNQQRISSLHATGKVTLVSGPDSAEAAEATYDVDAGNVVLKGDVVLSQGKNVLTGDTVTVDLASGSAQASGRVRSVLQPGSN